MIYFTDNMKKENIKKADLIFYVVNKEDVTKRDTRKIQQVFSDFSQIGKEARSKLMITFDGYDNDEREIYEIEEIREFVKDAFSKCNYMF